MNKDAIAIILARMGSSRLPGKSLIKINGVPLIKLVYNRVLRSKNIKKTIVATSTNSKDDALKDYCEKGKIPVFRGSENDVLKRFFDCSLKEYKKSPINAVVRVTADAPFFEPNLADEMINKLMENNLDYIHNRHLEGPPIGFHSEVISYKTLRNLNENIKDKKEREHVTLHVLKPKNRSGFKIGFSDVPAEFRRPGYRLVIDEKKDLELVSEIYKNLGENASLKEVIEYLDKNKILSKINSLAHLDYKNLFNKQP
jgi:spore coat polysaccharide biosynthesis protein SpsF